MTPEEHRERYYNSKGGCLLATGIMIILFLISAVSIAQPIKTGPVKSLFEGYNPQQPAVIEKAVPGPRGPQGMPGKTQLITKVDTVPIIVTDLSAYVRVDRFDDIMYNNFNNVYTSINSLGHALFGIDSVYKQMFNSINIDFSTHKLRNTGHMKILSGIGLQVIALGLVAYSDIDIVTEAVNYSSYPISYTIKEYNITEQVSTINHDCDKPWPHCNTQHPLYRYTLSSKDVDKVTHVITADNFAYVTERNKLPYYISAGILTGAGIVLEVLGIIDLHNAKLYASDTGMGLKLNF